MCGWRFSLNHQFQPMRYDISRHLNHSAMQRSPINIPPNNELTVPALEFGIIECVSENGLTTKVLDLKYMQSNNIVRCVTIGCDVNDLPIEKHVTYKFQWDMARVAKEWNGGARVSFRYVETPATKNSGLTLAPTRLVSP